MRILITCIVLSTVFWSCRQQSKKEADSTQTPVINTNSPDPHRFDGEIKKIAKLPIPEGEGLTVFTGSSSIRMWDGIEKDCSGVPVVNTGFGGSHMSDLLFFIEQTVLRFQPDKVFIYEGDNDIAAEKSPKAIMKTTEQVVYTLLKSNPDMTIHFIGAKPSASRWKYKEQYIQFNTLLANYCDKNPRLFYIDVWEEMLGADGRPNPNIFISDSLHMNRKGYLLWKDIVCKDFKINTMEYHNKQLITNTVENYFYGYIERDAAKLSAAFDVENGTMKVPFTSEDRKERYQNQYFRDIIPKWAARDKLSPETIQNCSLEILNVDVVESKMGIVTINMKVGDTTFIDVLSLQKLNGDWKITNKMYIII